MPCGLEGYLANQIRVWENTGIIIVKVSGVPNNVNVTIEDCLGFRNGKGLGRNANATLKPGSFASS